MIRENSTSLPLGRILGIPISLDWSWFLIFGVLTWSLATGYFPDRFGYSGTLSWSLGAGAAILLFVSVLLHELGHAVLAMAFHIPVRRIRLMIFGGVAELGDESPNAAGEFLVAIAGPVVSALLGLGLGALWLLMSQFTLAPAAVQGPASALAGYLARINLLLAAFNLIPGFPLDGGRVLRAAVWFMTGSLSKATRVAGGVGRLVGFGFIGLGLFQLLTGQVTNGIWIAFIGMFLQSAATQQMRAQRVREVLDGQTVQQVMSNNYATLPVDVSLQRLVDAAIMGSGGRSYVVTDNDEVVGVLTIDGVRSVPMANWAQTTIGQAMTPVGDGRSIAPTTGLWTALKHMELSGLSLLPVVDDGVLLGVARRDDIFRFLASQRPTGPRLIRL